MFSLFKPKPKPTQPQTTGVVLHGLLQRGFLPWLRNGGNENEIFVADRAYALITQQQGFTAMRNSASYYQPQANDCDDMAIMAEADLVKRARAGEFGGLPAAFGYLWTDDHAWSVWVDPQLKIWLSDSPSQVITLSEFNARLVRFIVL